MVDLHFIPAKEKGPLSRGPFIHYSPNYYSLRWFIAVPIITTQSLSL